MANTDNHIKNLNFNNEQHSGVLEVANRLAELEQRKPHDSIRLLILEAGKTKITQLEQDCQDKSTQNP